MQVKLTIGERLEGFTNSTKADLGAACRRGGHLEIRTWQI